MKKKIIGVTPRILTENNVEKEFVNRRYLKPLHERGFNTLLLTAENPALEEILSLCDGFLITGGNDIDPTYFGQTNEENKSKHVRQEIDEVDRAVVEFALKHEKPLLGICRGYQAINIFLGGTLFQDIGSSHTSIKENHEVFTVPNRLIPFEDQILVNSYHHQALDKIADDLVIIARHTDGITEAFVHQKLPIFAVQWHPEINKDSKESKLIFDTFAKLF